MTQPLSPAAQAVLDAAKLYKEPEKYYLLEARVAAAALRAAAEIPYVDAGELLAIAAELENHDD